ncbi:ABC transporter substrate-binding protein [Pseudomonas sp. MAFF212428]|uniref:ABC transporter substrate-binding protein n=1 Tax=Pseudomonas brassicae TaxID=2708063 RepID=A0A6B3NZN5_9PSED|nr:substrate-binding domain-containing protein [Pseudomonas brassicae]NER59123.1 ABC transporter substrate-binding protein [Pseudomonas brassicae]NER65097.1 ABC transporter substrate-binding protein [Pseudomonas brassicae]
MQRFKALLRHATLLGVFWTLQLGTCANAADLQVLATTALKPFFEQMIPDIEKTTGHHLMFTWGASSGTAADTLPVHIRNAEPDAEVGIQQISELMAVPGIQVLGPLPEEVQRVNVIAAAVATHAVQPKAAENLIAFLQGAHAASRLKASGFDPAIAQ